MLFGSDEKYHNAVKIAFIERDKMVADLDKRINASLKSLVDDHNSLILSTSKEQFDLSKSVTEINGRLKKLEQQLSAVQADLKKIKK